MARGRKPIPTALKVLHGNPGKRQLPQGEPRPTLGLPDAPAHLTEAALVEWHRVGTELARVGVITHVDRAVLAGYCVTYARWVAAEEVLNETGGLLVRGMMGGLVA